MTEDLQMSIIGQRDSCEYTQDITVSVMVVPNIKKKWDNKVQYMLAQIGFAVGLGNVWRFPYLCSKHGGGAFLVPYVTMVMLLGLPLFYLELAIGQGIGLGSLGTWKQIDSRLYGIGLSSIMVCFCISWYYNVLIAWALHYFSRSFLLNGGGQRMTCPIINFTTGEIPQECAEKGSAEYYFSRTTLDVSESINNFDHPVWPIFATLVAAWIIVFICIRKGITSSKNVVYVSAVLPYIILITFLIFSFTLKGAKEGVIYLFYPQFSRVLDINMWKDAATQIFFSLGLGYGGALAFSSYNRRSNDCLKDAIIVTVVNCGTSILASVVVFAISGFRAYNRAEDCVSMSLNKTNEFISLHPEVYDKNLSSLDYSKAFVEINLTAYELYNQTTSNFKSWVDLSLTSCTIENELQTAYSGPGLAFIVFAEAVKNLPFPTIWGIAFFAMLINLGIGSMIGTMEGIITPLTNLFPRLNVLLVTSSICLFNFTFGTLFVWRNGSYMITIMDDYVVPIPLLLVAFAEVIGVCYFYGYERFSDDIQDMLGSRPIIYWKLSWKLITPLLTLVLLMSSLIRLMAAPMVYNVTTVSGLEKKLSYPVWSMVLVASLLLMSMALIPVVFIIETVRKGKRRRKSQAN